MSEMVKETDWAAGSRLTTYVTRDWDLVSASVVTRFPSKLPVTAPKAPAAGGGWRENHNRNSTRPL